MILPVLFHNLQGYDAHLFIKQLAKVSGDLTSIPTTEEKYITFQNLLQLINIIPKNMKKFSSKNLKYVLLILSSFFKHHSPISFQIFDHQNFQIFKKM